MGTEGPSREQTVLLGNRRPSQGTSAGGALYGSVTGIVQRPTSPPTRAGSPHMTAGSGNGAAGDGTGFPTWNGPSISRGWRWLIFHAW